MTESSLCPDCGAPLPPRTGGLCPKCLFAISSGETLRFAQQGGDEGAGRSTGGVFEDYDILGTLGRGGMGVIYHARHKTLGREVALKVIVNSAFADDEAMARFRAEAAAVARLDHPHLVPLYEVGEADGQPFFTMKLAPNGHLAARLSEFVPTGCPPAVAKERQRRGAELAAKIARAIHHAHELGILHRDLKPANILFDAADEPLVADFGLAKIKDAEEGWTCSGMLMGSPNYLSPEQAAGHASQITTATDVWGLGAVLYTLLTGRPPFQEASTMETVRAVLEDEPPQPSALVPAVERDLETICLKCLEKAQTKRFASASAFAEDLECWLRGDTIKARPATPLERAWKWSRRHPAWTVLGTALALATVAALAFSVIHTRRIRKERDTASSYAERAELERQRAESGSRAALDQLYASDMHLAAAALESGAYAQARRLLRAQLKPADERDRRGFEWHWLWKRATGDQVLELAASECPLLAVAFTPDGRRIASLAMDGELLLWDASSGDGIVQLEVPSPASGLPLRQPGPGKAAGSALTFTPDGRWLAVARGPQGAAVYDLAAGKRTEFWSGSCTGVAFMPGPRLVVAGGQPEPVPGEDAPPPGRMEMFFHELKDGRWGLSGTLPGGAIRAVFSADGRHFAQLVAQGRSRVVTGRMDEPGAWRRLGFQHAVLALALSPDGRLLAVSQPDEGSTVVRFIKLEEGQPPAAAGELAPQELPVLDLAFSPDGTRLATAGADQSVRVWDVASLKEAAVLRGHAREAVSVGWSPDGGRIVSAGRDGHVHVWNAKSTPAPGPLALDVAPPFFSTRDGALLAVSRGAAARPAIGSPTGRNVVVIRRETHAVCLEVPHKEASALGFTADGGSLLTWEPLRGTEQVRLMRWSTEDGTAQGEVLLPDGGVDWMVLALSADGKRVAGGGYRGMTAVWDLADARIVAQQRLFLVDATGIAWSPDSSRIAFAALREPILVREAETLRGGFALEQSGGPRTAVAWSPESRHLAAGCQDHGVGLWDARDGSLLETMSGHRGVVDAVAFSMDGRTLASAGFEGAVRLWSVAARRELAVVAREADSTHLAFTLDGTVLLHRSQDGALRAIEAEVGDFELEQFSAPDAKE